MKERKKKRSEFINASNLEEGSRERQEMASTMADPDGTYESILTSPACPPGDMRSTRDSPSSESTQLFSKPSLSYIELIANVILSSPSQKLNLASIYRAMEEQFPYLRSRGPGWRNSVRHNLSVNNCFVKVSRCEDGRGHYWGVHRAYLRDFQQGNFRQCRTARGKRKREQCDKVAGCLAWMETGCFLGSFCGSRSLGWLEPQCSLQPPRGCQMHPSVWTQPLHQPWNVNAGWVQSPSWTKHYYFPQRLLDSYSTCTAERERGSESTACRPPEVHDPVPKGTTESYDSRFMTPPVHAFSFPNCWCMSQVIAELKEPLPYKFNFQLHS